MIAMFDSGLGGLSVWKAVANAVPDRSIIYLADQAFCPYGGRYQAEIIQRCQRIADYFVDQGASLLVIACNTATTTAITYLRETLSIPIVGIEPGIKPAAIMSKQRRIAVFATQATLKSQRLATLLSTHAADIEVVLCEGKGWVERVEQGDLSSELTRKLIRDALLPLQTISVDCILLGCTHYPFLAPLIKEELGRDVLLYDPAEAVARRVQTLLPDSAIDPLVSHRFFTSSKPTLNMENLLPVLIQKNYVVDYLTI